MIATGRTADTTPTDEQAPSDFERVYSAAKALDANALSELIEEGVCIDVLDSRGLWSAAGKIASESHLTPKHYGNVEDQIAAQQNADAVKLLLKFRAHPDLIAAGAAYVGDIRYAEWCRTELGAHENYIARGAALGKQYGYAQDMFNIHRASIGEIIFGLAANGDLNRAEDIANTFGVKEKLMLVGGAAFGKHHDYVRRYCKTEQENNRGFLAMDCAAQYAAQVGDIEFAEELRKLYPEIQVPDMVKSAALGGHMQYAQQLLDLNPSGVDKFIDGAAHGGHFKHIQGHARQTDQFVMLQKQLFCALLRGQKNEEQRLRTEKSKSYVWRLVMTGENFTLAYDLVLEGRLHAAVELYNQHTLTYTVIMSRTVKAMYISPYFSNEAVTLHKLSFIDDHQFLLALAERVKEEIAEKKKLALKVGDLLSLEELKRLEDEHINKLFQGRSFLTNIEKIVRKAIKINRLMREFYFNYDEALIFVNNKALRNLLILLPTVLNPQTLGYPTELMYLIIAGFGALTYASAHRLVEKITLVKLKSLFARDMTAYANTFFSGWASGVYHGARATSLVGAVKSTATKSDYKALLKYQKDLFTGAIIPVAKPSDPKYLQPLTNLQGDKDGYLPLISKHQQRLFKSERPAEEKKGADAARKEKGADDARKDLQLVLVRRG